MSFKKTVSFSIAVIVQLSNFTLHADDGSFIDDLIVEASKSGDSLRGAHVFVSAKTACVSCHRVGNHGGTVGPDLSSIANQLNPQQIVESVFWPKRNVKPEYIVWQVITDDGKLYNGYKRKSDADTLELFDLSTSKIVRIDRGTIEEEIAGSTPMPDQLAAQLSRQQQRDLIRFLIDLKFDPARLPANINAALAHGQMRGPVSFPEERKPLWPDDWPHSNHPKNQHRYYEFYTKQAEYFRTQVVGKKRPLPMLVAAFPGLDGGTFGHWGYQPADVWTDNRWNETQLSSLQSGVFYGGGVPISRAVCIRLGESGEVSACFNPSTLSFDAVWTGGFVKFSAARHGFLDGIRPVGKMLPKPRATKVSEPFVYNGFYRVGKRVVFSYEIDGRSYLDSAWVENGEFVRERSVAESHSMRHLLAGGASEWPEEISTKIQLGTGRPYSVDTIELPFDNPWKCLMFCTGNDFLSDGSAIVCTIQGDVWRVTGLNSTTAKWRRIAAGLHHATGLVVHDDQIFVQCRDQITRLHDLNGDWEIDFYECFSNAFETSPAGHDFICGLERDRQGNFYLASGNQGLVRISPDGKQATVIATGVRNPDGIAVLPDGTVTAPSSEGEWTPASMICAVKKTDTPLHHEMKKQPPHFGYLGPKDGLPPELPLAYIPRGLDNSSGGQVFVNSRRWGPLNGQLLHLSFGMGTHFLVLKDEVDGQPQGAIVPLVGDFRSGIHRGRFSPHDGQLYVTGMHGWVSFTPDDGCFQRVRYTGDAVQLPTGFHVFQNGIRVTFSQPIERDVAENVASHFAQCWNYRYSAAYGSTEYSPSHPGVAGHDPLKITNARVLADGHSLFLEILDIQPVSQLQLRLHVNNARKSFSRGHTLFITVHKLDAPFEDFPEYVEREKIVAAHPLLTDLAFNAARVTHPWAKKIPNAREIRIQTGKNLTYKTPRIVVRAGEPIAFTLENPDVVPHNWALVKPGALRAVGELADRLISDPDSAARQYVPKTDNVLVYTDVVPPKSEFTVYFRAPDEVGRYPFLCTFPGHWMVMNGEMIVE